MKRRRRIARRVLRGLAIVLVALLGLTIALLLPLRWLDPPSSSFMLQREFQARRAGELRFELHFEWRPLEEISPYMALAVVAAEDQRFPDHWGLDLESIRDAVEDSRRGVRRRGASTISQQVAKNLFLWSATSYSRKSVEAWITLWIETLWPKRRILEVYLNVAEFGDGIYGVEAAARHYLGKRAAGLAPAEAALLAAVLPNPQRLRAARPSPYLRERQAWIIQQMDLLGGPYYLREVLEHQ